MVTPATCETGYLDGQRSPSPTLFDHLIPLRGGFQLFVYFWRLLTYWLLVISILHSGTTECQNPHPPSNHSFLIKLAIAAGTIAVRRTNRAYKSHVASLPHFTVLHCAPCPETLVPVANGPIANKAVAYIWVFPTVQDAGTVPALAAL